MSLFGLVAEVYANGHVPQGGGQASGAGEIFMSLLPLILIFAVFYLLLIRPQQKKARQHREMIESIRRGDKVITSGGIYGVVENVGNNTVVLKISENVKIKFGKGHIATIRSAVDED